MALSISIVLHAAVLSIHFKLPDTLRRLTPSQLDVVLVNSKTRSRPAQPEVHAQADLDGGGDTDLDRRASSPFPALQLAERGTDLKQATRRVQELETRQRELLSQTQPREEVAAAGLEAEAKSRVSGVELAEVRYALYVEDWRQKIERIGNLNYPESARGIIYGSLRLTVSINSDGTVAGVDLEQSSGYKILDAAAQRIVELAAPYAKFPPDIRKETDILVITRTWHFARGDKVFSE
jgi:protein TonB